ncbi:MAG: glycosyltransferase [Desulfatiglandaceae bacterium]
MILDRAPSGKERRYRAKEDRKQRVPARILSLLTIFTGTLYLVWIAQWMNPDHPVMSGAFIGAEVLCLLLFILASAGSWEARFKPPEGLETLDPPPEVDILVTAAGEQPAIIKKTLEAVEDIDYPHKISAVLDDGADPEVRKLAREYSAHYYSRREEGLSQENAKAGNLNFGLSRTSAPFILTLDADQVPDSKILRALIGYMRFPELAFIQSRQVFLAPANDPFFANDQMLFDPVLTSFDSANTVISCGSGVLYRRKALASIGGFVEWNLVEDLTTAYELHAHGWKSFFFPHGLVTGTAPNTLGGVAQQRGQWCMDAMRLMFWDNPLFKKGLSLGQRAAYSLIGLSYFCSAFVFPFLFCIPLWTYLQGDFVVSAPTVAFGMIRLGYLVFMLLAIYFFYSDGKPHKQYQIFVGLFPMYIWSTIKALFSPPGHKASYKVNPKKPQAGRVNWSDFPLILPQLSLILAHALIPYWAITRETAQPKYILVNLFVSAVAIWSLWQIAFAYFAPQYWERGQNPEEFYGL